MSRSVMQTKRRTSAELGSAVLRHVSSEGCQILVGEARPRVGQRLRLRIEAMRQITGTVRWSVGDRAGFEFDKPICAHILATLQRLPTEQLAARLYLN